MVESSGPSDTERMTPKTMYTVPLGSRSAFQPERDLTTKKWGTILEPEERVFGFLTLPEAFWE